MTNQTKYPYTLIKFDKGICLMIDDNNTYSNFADLLSSKVSIEDTKKLYDDEGYDTLNDETGEYDPIYTLSVYLTEYEEHHEEWMWLYNNPYLDITYNNYDIFFLEKMPELVKQAFRLVWKDCNSHLVDDCLALARFINEYNYKLEQTSVQQVQESVNTSTPQIITQDILSLQSGIIAHQVNCQGVMGAGLAKQIRDKFPKAYDAYMKSFRNKKLALGIISPCQINDTLWVFNMCGQDRYGKDGKQYTDYDALATCLTKLHTKSLELGLTPYLPYNLGCGYGGGKWEIVYELISKHCPNAVICKLPDKSNKPVNTSTPQVHQPTVQTSVQEEQHQATSIDQEVMKYLNDYDDTFSYEGHQDYQEVYIPTTKDSPTPQQPVSSTPPKQYDLSKEYMDKFNISGLNLFTNATVHNW